MASEAEFAGGSTLIFDGLGGPIDTPTANNPGQGGTVTIEGMTNSFIVTVEPFTGRVTVERVGDAVRSLADKGVVSRQVYLQTEITNIEAQRELRQNAVLVLNATVGRNEAEQSSINLQSQRTVSIANELAVVRNRLAQNLARIRGTAERVALGPTTTESDGSAADDASPYRIVRRVAASFVELEATLDTPLSPGDAVYIAIPDSESMTPEQLGLPSRLPAIPTN